MNSLSSSWIGKWERVRPLLHILLSLKLKQKWFADYDFGKASSIFWCYVPDTTPCNIRGESVKQEVAFTRIAEMPVLQKSLLTGAKPLAMKSVACCVSLRVSGDTPQSAYVWASWEKAGRCEFSIQKGTSGASTLAETVYPHLGIVLKPQEIPELGQFRESFRFDGVEVQCKTLKAAFDLQNRFCEGIGDKGEFSYEIVLDSPYYSQLPLLKPLEGGLHLLDATPSDHFKNWWFAGRDNVPPEGRSLICNFPVGSVDLGEFACLYLDHFSGRFRFTLCSPASVKEKMSKLAGSKLNNFCFHDYEHI